ARGYDGFAAADRAVRALRRNSRHIGINCVLTRENFDQLGELFRYAKRRRLRSIELLRMKPTGRGAAAYDRLRCTAAQHEALLPTVLGLVRRHRIRVRLDCSLTPFIACHRPPRRLVEWLGIRGWIRGGYLGAGQAHGWVSRRPVPAPAPGGGAVRPGARWPPTGGNRTPRSRFVRGETAPSRAGPVSTCPSVAAAAVRFPRAQRLLIRNALSFLLPLRRNLSAKRVPVPL